MKADLFVKLMRKIISEEVRRVVREELRLTLSENTNTRTPIESYSPAPDLRSKYASVFDTKDLGGNKKVAPINNTSAMSSVNALLMETANQMKSDPGAQSFFEGLR